MKTKKRLPRKNPYEKWDVNQVMAEMERLECLKPTDRRGRWQRTYHLKWLGRFMLDLPEERRPKMRSSLVARLSDMYPGMLTLRP